MLGNIFSSAIGSLVAYLIMRYAFKDTVSGSILVAIGCLLGPLVATSIKLVFFKK